MVRGILVNREAKVTEDGTTVHSLADYRVAKDKQCGRGQKEQNVNSAKTAHGVHETSKRERLSSGMRPS